MIDFAGCLGVVTCGGFADRVYVFMTILIKSRTLNVASMGVWSTLYAVYYRYGSIASGLDCGVFLECSLLVFAGWNDPVGSSSFFPGGASLADTVGMLFSSLSGTAPLPLPDVLPSSNLKRRAAVRKLTPLILNGTTGLNDRRTFTRVSPPAP